MTARIMSWLVTIWHFFRDFSAAPRDLLIKISAEPIGILRAFAWCKSSDLRDLGIFDLFILAPFTYLTPRR